MWVSNPSLLKHWTRGVGAGAFRSRSETPTAIAPALLQPKCCLAQPGPGQQENISPHLGPGGLGALETLAPVCTLGRLSGAGGPSQTPSSPGSNRSTAWKSLNQGPTKVLLLSVFRSPPPLPLFKSFSSSLCLPAFPLSLPLSFVSLSLKNQAS